MPKITAKNAAGANSRREPNSKPMTASGLPALEVLMVADCWQLEEDAEPVIHRAISAAAEFVAAGVGDSELAIMLTDDTGIRTLNKNWRGIDKPTNVLSFPALQPSGPRGPTDPPRMLGDIAIAYQTTRREADEEQNPLQCNLPDTATHHRPHLIGSDQEKDRQAETMEELEREILSQLGIPDPYAERKD